MINVDNSVSLFALHIVKMRKLFSPHRTMMLESVWRFAIRSLVLGFGGGVNRGE